MNAREPEFLEEAIRGSHLNASVLGEASGPSVIGRFAFSEVCLDTAILGAPMLFTGEMPRDRLSMIYVRQCPSDGHSFNFSRTHRSGVIGVFAPGVDLDAATPAGYANATFSISMDALRSRWSAGLPEVPEDWISKGAVLTPSPVLRRAMDAFLSDLESWSRGADVTTHDPEVVKRIEDELMEHFIGATCGIENELEAGVHRKMQRRYAWMRRVRDYLRERPTSPVRVDELCAAVGISRRGLEYLFKDLLGVGVNTFIRLQRLHGARRAILGSHPAPGVVKQIALEWGFWHLGRFSAEYKSQFGELPAATMARTSARR